MLSSLRLPVRSACRWPTVVLLVGNAAIHLYLVPMHLVESPHVGAIFIALAVASLLLAAALVITDTAATWIVVGTINLLALIGLLGSRTESLPEIRDEVGQWFDPLSTLAIVVEAMTVMFAAAALRWWRTDEPAG